MLFGINKERSLYILKIAMALIIMLLPSLGGLIPPDSGVYAMFIISALLFAMRLKKTEKLKLSIIHFIFLILLFYSAVSFFWADNKSGHITYITAISAVILFFSIAADYFDENSDSNVRRRMMYMLCAGATICAVLNIVYWLFKMVPYGIRDSFYIGLGSSDYLAVFMMICIFSSVSLLKGNSKRRKALIITAICLMLFVFIMAKSLCAWMIAVMLGVIYTGSLKAKKMFVPLSVICFAVFTGILVSIGSATSYGSLFCDMFSYGTKNFFGVGGGTESFGELYMSKVYPPEIKAGILPMVYVASGGIGVLCTACVLARTFIQFVKLRTWESIVGVFTAIMLLIVPFSDNCIILFLWAGLLAYNEKSASFLNKRIVSKDVVHKANTTVLALCIAAAVLLSHFFVKDLAQKKYDSGDYIAAYSLYKSASVMNVADSDSLCGAAMSLCESGNEEMLDKALEIAETAQKRNKKDMDIVALKAKIYTAAQKYDLAAQEYRVAASNVIVRNKYNLALVKVLYKTVKNNERGSSETKRAYEEIVKIAELTDNLDYKKKINDIADKALAYTKGDL